MFQKHKQDLVLSWTFTQDVTFLSVGLSLYFYQIRICFERFDCKSHFHFVTLHNEM